MLGCGGKTVISGRNQIAQRAVEDDANEGGEAELSHETEEKHIDKNEEKCCDSLGSTDVNVAALSAQLLKSKKKKKK